MTLNTSSETFDVTETTGFMPPFPPVRRLPSEWEVWETTLKEAINQRLQVGDTPGLSHRSIMLSEKWRQSVREMRLVDIQSLEQAPEILRRAHLVLTYMLAFYVQTIPPEAPVKIPQPLSVPLLRISERINLPPILTYSDTVLYNWKMLGISNPDFPSPNIRSETMFTGLRDEEEFYLSSARIELRGAEALNLMRRILDDILIDGADSAISVTNDLQRMAVVIGDLRQLLLAIKDTVDPEIYYNVVRPYFRGQDSDLRKRKWVFEGLEETPNLSAPEELSGPSAGQSSVIHVLDLFLGVDTRSSAPGEMPAFMSRMRKYMPAGHRAFLDHLANHPRPLRQFILNTDDKDLRLSFNDAVMALKEFRDAHIIIVATYIIGPARKAQKRAAPVQIELPQQPQPLLGTGGTDLVKFLKELRRRTLNTLLPSMPLYRSR